MILKHPIFGVFEAKYLWKFLSISGKTYIIRIVSSRRIFEKKNGDYVICTLTTTKASKRYCKLVWLLNLVGQIMQNLSILKMASSI